MNKKKLTQKCCHMGKSMVVKLFARGNKFEFVLIITNLFSVFCLARTFKFAKTLTHVSIHINANCHNHDVGGGRKNKRRNCMTLDIARFMLKSFSRVGCVTDWNNCFAVQYAALHEMKYALVSHVTLIISDEWATFKKYF
jgi:hypothetical protein